MVVEHARLRTADGERLIADLLKMGWIDTNPHGISVGFRVLQSPRLDDAIVLDSLGAFNARKLPPAGQFDVYLQHKMSGMERMVWTVREWMHL